ncbi:MAG TPA: SH3 domain-containing protein [Rhizomicrobium sp.]|nr:SH3 domain-containing protein [Rhizomicrobium sp.]
MEEAELRRQERALMRGIGICLFAFAAGMGLFFYNAHNGKFARQPPAQITQPAPPPRLAVAPVAPPPIAMNTPAVRRATQPGPCFVHRAGSDLRDKPKSSGHVLKKEAKGARLILVALEDGGWAKVTDGPVTGYMRASVLGADPPG